MKSVRAIVLFAIAAMLGLIISGSAWGQQPESTFDAVKKRGVLKAGVKLDYPPCGSLDKDGKPYGWGIDVAKAVADKLGVKVEYVQTLSKTRIQLLQNGNIDAEFNCTTPTVERENVVDFSIIYGWETVVPLFRKGEATEVKNITPPKTIGLIQASVFLDKVKSTVPNAQLKFFQEYTDGALAVANKQIDALIVGKITAVQFSKQNAALEVGPDFYKDAFAVMVRQNDSKWRNFINKSLQELWYEGKFQAIWEKHWGYPPDFKMYSEFGLEAGVGK
jgi:polar amino acid transport system substrate-binding protein